MDSGDSCDNPGLGGRLLIRRLELESQLVTGARQRRVSSAEPLRSLPPLELPTLCAAKPAFVGSGAATAAQLNGSAAAATKLALQNGGAGLPADVPDSYLCPLTQRVMTDPVVTPGERLCPLLHVDGRLSDRKMAVSARANWLPVAPNRLCSPIPAISPPPFTGGITYDRGILLDWIKRNGTDPATGHPLAVNQLYSNLNLRDQVGLSLVMVGAVVGWR
jgi:hypothetical protein